MGQCTTLNDDCDYSSCDNTIPTSHFIWNKLFSPLACLLFLIIKVAASYFIASLIF